MLIYKIYDIGYQLDMGRLFELPTLAFNLYYMVKSSCLIEEDIYDLAIYCSKQHCDFETLFENVEGSTFRVIGTVNAIAAIMLMPRPTV